MGKFFVLKICFFHKLQFLNKEIIFIFILIISGCNSVGETKFNAISVPGEEKPVDMTPVEYFFEGLQSSSLKSDSGVTLHWAPHAEATGYDLFVMNSNLPIFYSSISDGTTNQINLKNLTPGGNYTFWLRMKDELGRYDTNTQTLSVTMDLKPSIPSSITIASPGSAGFSSSITVLVGGVKEGDTVKLYSDSACSVEVASGISSGPTKSLSLSSLGTGTHPFYAQAINAGSIGSGCSSDISVVGSYEKTICPDGYILVEGNTDLGTNDFCVMKYEAKCATSLEATSICPNTWDQPPGLYRIAVSVAKGIPWYGMLSSGSTPPAQSACQNLNILFGVNNKFDLISNSEWMTIARSIEVNPLNWSGGSVGNGFINQGHSDRNPNYPCEAGIENIDTNCTTSGTAPRQKRTHTLESGEVIWDFAGNASELVDWVTGLPFDGINSTQMAYFSSDNNPTSAIWRELTQLNRRIDPSDVMNTLTWQPLNPSLNSTHGMGKILGGSGTGRRAYRGGGHNHWNWDASSAGIYSLDLNFVNDRSPYLGFRCVYRP